MASLKDRFEGGENAPRLIAALRQNRLVYEDSFASDLAPAAKVEVARAGETLIHQGNCDDDILFILAGRVSITINGREIAIRAGGQHVGEMALLDPSAKRSASVIAIEETAFARIAESDFTKIAAAHPNCWRFAATELADRLRQRNRFVKPPNPRPVIFIGSAKESADVAQALGELLAALDVVVRVWTDRGIFGASKFPIEDLEQQVQTSDFAVVVMTPDDMTISRGKDSPAPRDNAVFELGLFMGSLTRERSFLLVPNGVDIKIPTDLLGLTQLRYTPAAGRDNLLKALEPCREDLRVIIERLGVR